MSFWRRHLNDLQRRWIASSPKRRALFLVFSCTIIYLLVNWRNYSVDYLPLSLVPVTVLREGTARLDTYRPYYETMKENQRYTFIEHDHHLYSMKPYFVSLMALPFYLPPVLMGVDTLNVAFWVAWGRIVAAVFAGTAVGVIYLSLRRWTEDHWALAFALLFAFGTAMWTVVGQTLTYHTGACLCVALLVYLLDGSPLAIGRGFAAGFLAGLCVGARPTTVVLLLPLGLYLCLPGKFRSRSALLAALIGVLTAPACNAALNVHYFNDWKQTGYSAEELDRWNTPFVEGFVGILFAPNSGFMVQSPFLLLGIVGTWLCWKRRTCLKSQLLLAYSLCIVGYVALFASWHDWQGGLTPCSRMLSESYPLLMPLVVVGWNSVGRRWFLALTGIWSTAYQLIALSTFDAICQLDPHHEPWLVTQGFFWIYVREFGWLALASSVMKSLILLVPAVAMLLWLARSFMVEAETGVSRGPE